MVTSALAARTLVAMLAAASLLVGCGDAGPEDGIDETATLGSDLTLANGQFTNGQFTNGQFTNGQFTNGQFTNGQFTNGSSLVGWSLSTSGISGFTGNHVKIASAWLSNGKIYVKGVDGIVRSGASLQGTTVTGKLNEDGQAITLTIEKISSYAAADGDTLEHSTISFTIPGIPNVKAYVCGKSNGVPVQSIPVYGRWNYSEGVPGGGSRIDDMSTVTFACDGYAIHKCLSAGYHLWDDDLADHHQACVRLIRADYCGNGKPYTIDGTLVNMYDHIGLEGDTENWPFEAEWDEDGAVCLNHQRIQQPGFVPSCAFEKAANKCGKNIKWNHPTLLASEAQ